MSRTQAQRARRMPPRSATARLTRRGLLDRARWTLRGLIWCATALGVVWGLRTLEPIALAQLQSGPWRIQWRHTPTWYDVIREHVEADIGPRLAQLDGLDFGHPQLAAELNAELTASPWIGAVSAVNKRSDGIILVDAQFRKPLTRIDHRGLSYLVDETGHRLPGVEPLQGRQPDGFVHLEGVHAPPPAEGQLWQGEDVRGGLATIRFLHEHAPLALRVQMTLVNVADYNGKPDHSTIRIRGIAGDYIVWGLPPGEEYERELVATEKFAKLNAYFLEFGRLPTDCDLRYFTKEAIFARPAPPPTAKAQG